MRIYLDESKSPSFGDLTILRTLDEAKHAVLSNQDGKGVEFVSFGAEFSMDFITWLDANDLLGVNFKYFIHNDELRFLLSDKLEKIVLLSMAD